MTGAGLFSLSFTEAPDPASTGLSSQPCGSDSDGFGDVQQWLDRFFQTDVIRTDPIRRDLTRTPGCKTAAMHLPEADAVAGIPLDLRGSDFQRRVWRAITRIAPGQTLSYAGLAVALGKPGAARAVASACAVNPLALIVPCHRVVGSDGSLRGYRWGLERKRQLLALERSRMSTVGDFPN